MERHCAVSDEDCHRADQVTRKTVSPSGSSSTTRNAADLCRYRAVLAPRHEHVDRFRRALEDRFDPAVGQVAYHPTQTRSSSTPGAGHAVAHALYSPLDDDSPADHPRKIRLRSVPSAGSLRDG